MNSRVCVSMGTLYKIVCLIQLAVYVLNFSGIPAQPSAPSSSNTGDANGPRASTRVRSRRNRGSSTAGKRVGFRPFGSTKGK